jgi:LCP family protein required for cell wall assembly
MTNKKALFLINLLAVIFLMLVGCGGNLAGNGSSLVATSTPQTKLIAADLNNLGLGDVFMPVDPTPADEGPIFPTATPNGNEPTDWSSVLPNGEGGSALQPATPLKIPDDQVNILLLGSDQRPYEGGFRTDVIMLVSINLDSQTVNLISFPRDLYVYLPGLYSDRINSAMVRGGFQLIADTLEFNFGIRPDYYGMINFWSFKSLINTLGGIDVQIGRTLSDHRDGYGTYTVYPGTVRMDAETALWYVRSRYTSSDFDRTRRQQEVVSAIVRRLLSFDVVTRFPSLYAQYNGIIETNLPLSEVTPLLPLADEIMGGQFGTYAVGESYVSHWRTPSGSAVLLPNKALIRDLLLTALGAE